METLIQVFRLSINKCASSNSPFENSLENK